jgi:hypothetical protein
MVARTRAKTKNIDEDDEDQKKVKKAVSAKAIK